MKKIEGIYDSVKFGKKELRKIKGGVKATNTNHFTNIPRKICGEESLISTLDSDTDS